MSREWCKAISRGKTGVKFSDSHREAIRQARLGTHSTPETKAKLSKIHRKSACSPEWLERVSQGTRKAMRNPSTRRKHLAGLRRARAVHGINFKGGSGQQSVPYVVNLAKVLCPLGYIQEFPVRGLKLGKGKSFRLDFALPKEKIAIECDGAKHRPFSQKEKDKQRDVILKAHGWKVIRVVHD